MARSIEVQEHPTTQRRIKVAQRIGVLVLALLLLAAVLGTLGVGGPLSNARVTQGGVDVLSPRFTRYLAPTRMEVDVARAAADTVTLTLQGDHADAFLVEVLLPRPDKVATTGDATIYTFAAVAGQPHRIRLEGQMERIGPLAGSLRIDDGPAVAIDTFVFP